MQEKQCVYKNCDIKQMVWKIIEQYNIKKIFLVCGKKSYVQLPIRKIMNQLQIPIVYFNEFEPNPRYESVVTGVHLYQQEQCDFIVAIGGGSAIDVAKCIRCFSTLDKEINYLSQTYHKNDIKLLAIPTTAGTGSEATHFAVLYYEGKKYSVSHESVLPEYVILDESNLLSLPVYQKKSAMMDALCQAIESWWSLHANEESIYYAKEAIRLIFLYYEDYIVQESINAAKNILWAAHLSGKAINITTTTAPHAMSYKLTSLYGISHGHAVALCLPVVWEAMLQKADKECFALFGEIAKSMGSEDVFSAIERFRKILYELQLFVPQNKDPNILDKLIKSVNLERLKNNPIQFDSLQLRTMYKKVLQIR